MTIRQKIQTLLEERALFEDEAKAIVSAAENHASLQPMQGRWDDAVSDYPAALLNVTWMSVKHFASEWLKTNSPQHFALGMLMD